MLRIYHKNAEGLLKPQLDVLCLSYEADELIDFYNKASGSEVFNLYQAFGDNKPTPIYPSKVEALSVLLYDNGKETQQFASIHERRAQCMEEFRSFGGADFLLGDSTEEYKVLLSEKCNRLLNETLAKFTHDGK